MMRWWRWFCCHRARHQVQLNPLQGRQVEPLDPIKICTNINIQQHPPLCFCEAHSQSGNISLDGRKPHRIPPLRGCVLNCVTSVSERRKVFGSDMKVISNQDLEIVFSFFAPRGNSISMGFNIQIWYSILERRKTNTCRMNGKVKERKIKQHQNMIKLICNSSPSPSPSPFELFPAVVTTLSWIPLGPEDFPVLVFTSVVVVVSSPRNMVVVVGIRIQRIESRDNTRD